MSPAITWSTSSGQVVGMGRSLTRAGTRVRAYAPARTAAFEVDERGVGPLKHLFDDQKGPPPSAPPFIAAVCGRAPAGGDRLSPRLPQRRLEAGHGLRPAQHLHDSPVR